nr:reverse transcriptase domain-containing protein [Tanacetum cinerariifolium]
MDQNINSSSFDQIQPPQYHVIHHPSQETSEEILHAKENLMKSIQTFLKKFNRISFGEMPKVLSRAWEKFFEIQHAQPEDTNELLRKLLEDLQIIKHSIQYKEYLKNSPNAITTVLPTKEADEYEVTSDNESECDVLVKDESSSIFTTLSNPTFDYNDDFTSSDDELLSKEDVPMKIFKIYSNPLFDDEEINSNKIDPHYFNVESNLIESLSNRDTLFDSSPKFDYLKYFSGEIMPTSIINEERIKREHEEYISLMEKLLTINSFPRPLENFHANTIIETLSMSPIPVEDSDSLKEEIDIFTGTDDFMPPGIESDNYDSKGDTHFLEELLSNDSIYLPKNESSNFDHHDDPSFPHPPPKLLDVEIFFEPDSGVLTTNVVKGISEHYVLMPNILHTLPTFDPLYPVYDTLLPFSSEYEDKVFKHGTFTITQVFPYGTVELFLPNGPNFKVNGHRVKHYFGRDISSKDSPQCLKTLVFGVLSQFTRASHPLLAINLGKSDILDHYRLTFIFFLYA